MDTLTSVSCIALARTPGTGLIGHIDYGVSLLGYLYPVPLGSGHAKNCRSTYFFRPNWLGVINTVCLYLPDILKVSVYMPIFCRQAPGLDVKIVQTVHSGFYRNLDLESCLFRYLVGLA
jgi:hypothetical protein